jgi:hypothetical protein
MAPYIEPEPRKYFDEKPQEAKTDGDITYVFYKQLVKQWKAEPRWTTYAKMRKAAKDARHMPTEMQKLIKGLAANGAGVVDMIVAYDAAVDEIKRQYVDKYEDDKLKLNGAIE